MGNTNAIEKEKAYNQYTSLPTSEKNIPHFEHPSQSHTQEQPYPMNSTTAYTTKLNRYTYASILTDNVSPFEEDQYIEVHAMYPISGTSSHVLCKFLVPYIVPSDKNNCSHSSTKYTGWVYVNIMNIQQDIPYEKHTTIFVKSIYSLETMKAFAKYAYKDTRNIVKSINSTLGIQTYWMRIPEYTMPLDDIPKLHDMISSRLIVCDKHNMYGLNPAYQTDCLKFIVFYEFMDTFLTALQTTTIGKLWFVDEITMPDIVKHDT